MPPPITALEGDGSGSLGRKQRYTVTELRDCKRGDKGCKKKTVLFSGQLLSAVPSNIGPFSMPNYAALAAQGIYDDASTGARVFAGQRAETFAIDLGAVFDTLNLRRNLPILTVAEDADDNANPFGFNAFSGFNVNTIALELPIARVTSACTRRPRAPRSRSTSASRRAWTSRTTRSSTWASSGRSRGWAIRS